MIHIHQTYTPYTDHSQHPKGEVFHRLVNTERLVKRQLADLPLGNGSYWAKPAVVDNPHRRCTYHREYRKP